MNLIERSRPQLERLLAGLPEEAKRAREEAWRRMETLGLPDRRTETWKYSNLSAVERVWAPDRVNGGAIPAQLMTWCQTLEKDFDIQVYDGPQLVRQFGGGSDLTTKGSETFDGEDGFANLTSALSLSAQGLRIKKSQTGRPLLIVRYISAAWSSSMQEVHVEAGASLDVVEILVGPATPYYRGQLMKLNLEKGARLNWVRSQCEGVEGVHFSETQAHLAEEAKLHWTAVHRGARWVRSQMRVDLAEIHAEARVHGLTFGDREQQIDQRIVLQHLARETESEQLIKGIFGGRAKGTVNGKILIAQDAQKVFSKQLNHNLLLTKTAETNTKPELEIYADDVKANHGATVGRLDDEKLFYLRSRGLSAMEAERLLSLAFAEDVYMKIPSALARPLAEANHVF